MAIKCPKCDSDNPDTKQFCGECGTQLLPTEEASVPTETLETPKQELIRGATFGGRYEIIEELGKGGMGKVYRVEDKKIKEEVALKLIKPEIAADKKNIERFSNELKFARKIAHRNVCKMYDLSEEKGTHYITMEYVPGEDLKSMIRMSKQLSVATAIDITKQVCEGLSEAHRIGVVHRDLKPSNIMIDKDGNARIMDFGIARSLEAKGITGAGTMIGTPEYMSPEQVEGKGADQRSDVYSLGVILYEMVTGRVPFEGETPLSIAVKHKTEAPREPRELNAQIPEDLSRVIMRCLEKDKDKRYQSTGEVRSELTNIEKGIPTTERIIPKRKPLTSREITVTFGLKKLFVPGLIIIAVVILGVLIWQLLPKKEAIPVAPTDKPSLAIMYFKNNTGDDSYDHWRSALSDLLISDLAQSKYLRVMGGDKLYNILRQLDLLEADSYSSEDLEKIASRGGVNHILLGNLTKAGDNFRINTTLQEAGTGELIGSESVDGIGEASLISMVDELTTRIKRNFKLSSTQIESDIDRQIGKVTTSSPEAYKYYHEGIKYDNKGDYPKVVEFMEKAIAVDPEFASAYHVMSWAYGNQGYFAEEMKYLEKALELSDRLSDREKYRIQGSYYLNKSEITYDKAIEAYEKLLELYPDDLIGNNDLAVLYRSIGEWDKSIEKYKACIEAGGEDVVFYTGLAANYRSKGLFDEAKHVLEQYLNDVSDSAFIRNSLALHYRYEGKYDLALAEVDKALSIDPNYWRPISRKGDIYIYMGDLEKAEQEYKKLQELKEPAVYAWSLMRFARLYLLQGRFEDAKEKIKVAIELAEKSGQSVWIRSGRGSLSYVNLKQGHPDRALQELNKVWSSAVQDDDLGEQIGTLLDMGLAYLEMESIDEAQSTAVRLKKLIEQGMNKRRMGSYHYLMGRIELEKKNYSKAIEYFNRRLPLLSATSGSHLLLAYHTGLAYYKMGDLEKAREEYEKIMTLTEGRISNGDTYAKSFYMLGKMYEQKGWKGKALEHYEKFLTLRKDADPGIAEVEDAKKRLAALKT
jgi:serine/threonine protein kinase/Tfp pilus assembly protein PilF